MRVSYKRVAVCYLLVVLLLFICVFRIFTVMRNEKYSAAAEDFRNFSLSIGFSRGTVYDCNMSPITNQKQTVKAVIFNKSSAISALYGVFSGEEIKSVVAETEKNGFAVRTLTKEIEADGIYCFKTTLHADDGLSAKHVVGYADAEGKGQSGIEAAFNSLLSSEGENTVTFSLDGQGKLLGGEEPTLSYDYATEHRGVVLTIDKNIQQIAEQKAMSINAGAVVVTDVKTGEIKALVSRPDFRLSDLSSALNNPDSPLLNRAFCTYNIGSVFKPYVAAAGYETGVASECECVGYTSVGGLNFTCHNLGGHGLVNLSDALKFSCNSFFYDYIRKVGVKNVVSLAKRAGFESGIYLADGLSCRKGSLGNPSSFTSERVLANMSIGQGEIMLSPLAITNLYMAIAGDGTYRQPSLVKSTVEAGKIKEKYSLPASTRVMSSSTAAKLRNDLATVLSEGGTGNYAAPKLTTAAGKTGTAQTGVVKNGKKVTNSWFCGFFPLENPKYAVTVISENATEGAGSVFAAIADGITEYEIID